MSTCPIGSTTGFLNITGPLGPLTIDKIAVNGSPLTLHFAPRSIPATLVGNLIDESATNTVLYKGTQYALQSAQICAPSHKGYSTQTAVAEVALLFVNQQVISSYPSLILLIVPIYTGNVDARGAYLQQIMNGDATDASFATLQSLFYGTSSDTSAQSYGYKTCIELVSEDSSSALNTYVLYFPNGVILTQQEAVNLVTLASGGAQGVLPTFQIPPVIRGGSSTVLTFEVGEDGTSTPTAVSADGLVSSAGLSSASDDFTNSLQFFKKPPSISNTASGASCATPSTTQYKCLPISQINSNANYANAKTLPQVLGEQAAMAKVDSAPILPPYDPSDTTSPLSVIMDILIGVVALFVLGTIGYIVYGLIVPDVPNMTPSSVATATTATTGS